MAKVFFKRENGILSASHLPILTRIIDASKGPMLELGTGYYSTPIFHAMAEMHKRHCYSYESSPEWYAKALKFQSAYHHIIFIEDWETIPSGSFGIVFVDQSPNKYRRFSLKKFANSADYLIAHDSEIRRQSQFHLEKTLLTFKYRYDYKKIEPNVTVVSNFCNLKFLENP